VKATKEKIVSSISISLSRAKEAFKGFGYRLHLAIEVDRGCPKNQT